MLEQLKIWDRELFLWLNGFHNNFFDAVMLYTSNKYIWIPLYLILAYYIYRHFGGKTIWILLFAGILIALSDLISVHAFKNVFERLRPCHEPDLQGLVHIVNGKCGGKFGFYSSHATNHFALAGYLGLILGKNIKWFTPAILIWAAIVSYSRIYLGVHYPADVLAGALAGLILSFIIYKLFIAFDKLISPSE